ncbi:MAG: hypothetical protein AAGG79_04650, partial [Pseudomonadota bacterium]
MLGYAASGFAADRPTAAGVVAARGIVALVTQWPYRLGMVQTRLLSGLGEIADGYDALLCDAWGVIHNGQTLYPGAAEALLTFRRERGPILVLTNAPRLSHVIPEQLDHLGLPREAYDGVVTSGDATREVTRQLADKPFFRIGPAKDDTIFKAINMTLTSFEKAQAIFCSGLNDDQSETPEDYR